MNAARLEIVKEEDQSVPVLPDLAARVPERAPQLCLRGQQGAA
jgi:hypothetical protein